MERDYQLKKLMNSSCEEMIKINAAKKRWALLRKKKKIIIQIANIGGGDVQKLIQKTQFIKEDHNKSKEEKYNWQQKLIIPPNNFWNMHWNNFVVLLFILYMIILPLYICFDKIISEDNIN